MDDNMSIFYGRIRQRKSIERQDSEVKSLGGKQRLSRQSSIIEYPQVSLSSKEIHENDDSEPLLYTIVIFVYSFLRCVLSRFYSSIKGRFSSPETKILLKVQDNENLEEKEEATQENGKEEKEEKEEEEEITWKYIAKASAWNYYRSIKYLSVKHGTLLEVSLWLPLILMALYIVLVENGPLIYYPES